MSASATKISVSEITAFRPAPGAGAAPANSELIIQPRKGWVGVDWAELVRYRELLFFLVWRDIKVRYKQAVLGVLWAVLQPVINVVVFTLIFGVAAGLGRNLDPELQDKYPVFVFSGMILWQLFAAALNTGGMSLVNQQHLLTKIYFPRLFVPTSVVGSALVDMAVASVVFIVLMAVYGVAPTWGAVIALPLLVALVTTLALGMAYLLSALTVSYRDFRFIIPFMAQIWMWASFVAFPIPKALLDSPKWNWLLALNPMHGILAAFRKVVLGLDRGWHPAYLASSVAITAVVFVVGLLYFRRTERRFADIA